MMSMSVAKIFECWDFEEKLNEKICWIFERAIHIKEVKIFKDIKYFFTISKIVVNLF